MIASFIAEAPYSSSDVFSDIKMGDLWGDQATYVEEWYAVEAIDANTTIIGEPRPSQYSSSFSVDAIDFLRAKFLR